MFVSGEKLDSKELSGDFHIFDGHLYGTYKEDYWKEQRKPWKIIEGPFSNKLEAICRMNAIWLESKPGIEYQEKDRKRLLAASYYSENDKNIKQFWACHDCKVIYWHSLIHCPFCPNKMVATKGTGAELRKFIAEYRLGH